MAQKRLAILGATGSIGTQALEIVAAHPENFAVEILSAHTNADLVTKQALEFNPSTVVITDEDAYEKVKANLAGKNIEVLYGYDALNTAVQKDSVDMVLAAIMGFAGLTSTLAAIEAGKDIALANKESLVVAGEIVMAKAKEKNVTIYPVDSEHSAIYQCLVGEDLKSIEKIILTASGGPFLGKKPNFLVNVKKAHAMQHPNWSMGAKITIDSATLMNKGLEMIEAKWLFGLENDQIEVIVHPQSIIHSLVEFKDGSLKAQLGIPDMKVPIQYAIGYPNRLKSDFKKFSFKDYNEFTFEQPDLKTFKNLQLAIDAMHAGGNMPAIMNAANEVVVHAFLNNKVGFLEMSDIIENVMKDITFIEHPTLEELFKSDKDARQLTERLLKNSQLSNSF